ncbi:MAG TPA: hypothetical protein VK004_05220, partial [Ignavibacteria bacterium]|nr:hypothetical protein [Ignavibacteria bacterium]
MNECGFFVNLEAGKFNDEISKYKGKFDNIDIGIFHKTLPGYMPTPVHQLETLASELGIGKLYLKDESDRMGLK